MSSLKKEAVILTSQLALECEVLVYGKIESSHACRIKTRDSGRCGLIGFVGLHVQRN